MPARSDDWLPTDRDAFWTFVRGRMAERRLTQQHVADAIGLNRTVLSRRFNGEIKERPTAWTIEQLAALLKLSADERRQLERWSGLTDETGDHRVPLSRAMVRVVPGALPAQDAPSGPASPKASSLPGRRLLTGRTLAVVGGVVGIVFGLATLLAFWWIPVRPGGVWADPFPPDPTAGPIHVAARAYPTRRDDPPVAYVEFTASWDGRPGPWLVACRETAPVRADRYECRWDPTTEGMAGGSLRMSFDVYDTAGHVNRAPHGVRSIRYLPPAR